MENPAFERITRRWGWWTIGAAAAACLALAGLNIWQQDQSVRMSRSIQAYQDARARVTLAILDLAIAEDGGHRRSVGADLAHANEALSEVERLLPGIPGGADADGALIDKLHAMRQLVIADAANVAASGDMHHALEQAYRSMVVALKERGLIARAEVMSLNRRQTLVANSALLTALLALAATAALMHYLRQLRRRNQRRLAHLTQFRDVVGRIHASILHASDFPALARAVCAIATEINGVVCAAVHMHDPASRCLVRQGVSGPCDGLVGAGPLPVDESDSVTVRAFRGARRILVGRSGDAAQPLPCPADKACEGVRSMAAIPLMHGQTCVGVMTLLSRGEDFFHADSADLLEECAAAMSFAAQKLSAEKSMRDSESRYRTLVEVSPDGILVICDERIVMANTAARQLLGAQDADQVIGHELLEFAAPQQRVACRERMQQVLADQHPLPAREAEFLRVDGSSFHVEIIDGPFEYMGRPAILSEWHDLTSRRQSQQALAERERDLLLAQKAGQIGSAFINLQTATWTTSPVGMEILGVSSAQDRPIAELFDMLDPVTAQADAPRIRAILGSDTKSDSVYAIIRPDDGSRRWIRVITEPELRADGTPLRRVGVLLDVTQAQLAAQRIHQLSRLYETSSKVNAALSRESSFEAVCATICKVLVQTGGLAFAAVQLVSPGTDSPVSQSAHGARFGDEPQADPGRAPIQAFELQAGDLHLGSLLAAPHPGQTLTPQSLQMIAEACEALGFAHARYASEAARAQSEQRIAAIVDTAMDAIITCDDRFRIVTFNDAAAAMFGMPREQAIRADLASLLPPRFRAGHEALMRTFGADGQTYRWMRSPGMVIGLRANGEEFHSEASISHVRVGQRSFYTVIMRDVTARLAAEARINRLTKLYAAQSLANEAIVRGRNWPDLCQQVCRTIVEQGHLQSALIRLPDPGRQVLKPFVEFGQQGSGITAQEVAVTDHHPAAVAWREARPMRVADLRLETGFPEAVRLSMAQGAASAIVLPIQCQDGVLGTLSVFSGEPSYFDAEFEHLLLDLADNLAFAWDKLRSESEVRDSEERYRALFENSPDGLRIISEGRIVQVNPAYIRMFGEDHRGQSVEQAVFAHLDAETLTRVHERMQQVALNNAPAAPDVQMYRRTDGVVIPVESTSAPFMLGHKLAHLTIIRDLRDLHERQRALRAAETRYRSLVETSLSGIALAWDDKIEYANQALARMFGLDHAAQLEGRPLLALIDPAWQAISIERLHALAAVPGAVFPHGRLLLRTVHGDAIDVDLAAASIELDGRTMVLLEMRDVTREVIAKKGLRELNRSLENRVAQRTAELVSVNREMANVNRDLESFSYSVAHDLRAPLRHMAGFAHMIQMDVTEQHFDELPAHVERIVGGVNRMAGLIDGLLAVSRVAHVALNEEPVDLAALIREIIAELHAGPAVLWDISELPSLRGDKVLLRQVWTNLLSNALKYSAKAESPRIVVHSLQLGHEQVFSVRDNGAGFDPAHAAALFGVFKRLHSQQEFAGTGVGLAIVRRIVERHGGRIWADAIPGQGATFSFSLPLERLVASQPVARNISQS